MTAATTASSGSGGWAVRHGLIGGAIAGVIFALAEMVGSAVMGMPFLAPLQAFASLPLGIPPMEIPMDTAIPVGLISHTALSLIYGVAFALVVQNVGMLRSSASATVVAATLFGIVLWVVNFYVLAPLIGRPWFTMAPAIPQFIYHAFFYGTVLGLYLASQLRIRTER